MKRNFVYTTGGSSAANATHSPPPKRYKPFGENNDLINDDDDLLDAIGTQALEQFESDNNQPDETGNQCADNATLISQNMPSSSNVLANGHNQPHENKSLQLEAMLKQNKLLEQKLKLMQYSQAGEVKILREKLNQAETNKHTTKELEEHVASLSAKLKFKEQENLALYEKCKYLEQQQQNKSVQKEIPPRIEEMRVQSDIKLTPVRCRDAKNAQRNLKNFVTDFPTSDPLKAFSQQDATGSSGCCNKGRLKDRAPQQKHTKAIDTTALVMQSTPVVDQETQTPVDILRHGRIEDGITCMELNVPSMSGNGQILFNHLIHPKAERHNVRNDKDKALANVLSLIHPIVQYSSSTMLSQNYKDGILPTNDGSVISTHDRDHGMSVEDAEGEEEKGSNYFVSLELPTSIASPPFLRDPTIQHSLRKSIANMLGSLYLPSIYPELNLLPDLDTVATTRGDSGITLLLVLEKLVRRYCLERTKGQDTHCRSVESWVSGSLEGLLPSFASLLDEDRAGNTFRDPMRMDNVQAIVCIMEVLLELVRRSKPVRCHILDNFLGELSKPPLTLDVSNNGRSTPTEQEDYEPVTMECDNGMIIKTESTDASVNSISSYLKHLTVAPLAGKLTASQRANWMVEMTVSMSRKVLIEASSDASILSSVVGSYDDYNISGSASFMQQRSSSYNSSLHSSHLFSILLNLMEPSHRFFEEEAAMMSNALEILVVLAQDCSEHQMECYLEPTLGAILRSILCRGQPSTRVMVIELLYHLVSSQSVIDSMCSNNDKCPLLQAYNQLTNPPKPLTDIDIEYGMKILQMVARSVCTGNKKGGKPMFIFDFDCCCSNELIVGILAFTKRMVKNCVAGRGVTSNISYEVISQVILVLLPVIMNQDIGDDITHSDVYKHDYTEVVKGLSMVLLQCASSTGKWEQTVSTLKELLDYDDLQDCLNSSSAASIKKMVTD